MITKQIQVNLKRYRNSRAEINGTRETKMWANEPYDVSNVPSEDYKARVAQVQGEPLARLQFIGGLQDLHNMNHLRDVHRAFALPTRYGKWCSLSFFFSLFFWFLLFAHTLCANIWDTISTSAYNGRSETTRYQLCKAQAIINELASIGKVITRIGWLTKECKGRKNREGFIP